MLDKEQIDYCRRIGRDEENRRTTIGLTELDALCATADAAVDLAEALTNVLDTMDWVTTAAYRADCEPYNKAQRLLAKLKQKDADGKHVR